MLNTSTLRPGFLVSLKTSVSGNVSYDRKIVESDHTTEAGERRAKWETERTVRDPKEHERATEARGKACSRIRSICAKSAFGLLCPESASDELETAIAEARKIADEFNSTAALTRVSIFVMTGRIAPDDVEAVKAINSEITDLLSEMKEGVADLDVKRIRDAASKAKQLGSMLTVDAAARIQVAVEAARSAARKIVKAGEEAAQEVDRRVIATITEARTSFLDLDDASEVRAPEAVGRAIDLMPESPDYSERRPAAKRRRELEI